MILDLSWTILNHLAAQQLSDNFSIFKAYFHRLLEEYEVEAVEVHDIKEKLINSKNEIWSHWFTRHTITAEIWRLYM